MTTPNRSGLYWLAGGGVCALVLAAALVPFMVETEAEPEPGSSRTLPTVPRKTAAASKPPALPGDPEARLLEIKRVVRESPTSKPALRLLDSLSPSDPRAKQARAMLISALARYPKEPAAQAALLGCLDSRRPREERLLALSVLGTIKGSGGWSRQAVEPLRTDQDPAVRQSAARFLRALEDR